MAFFSQDESINIQSSNLIRHIPFGPINIIDRKSEPWMESAHVGLWDHLRIVGVTGSVDNSKVE